MYYGIEIKIKKAPKSKNCKLNFALHNKKDSNYLSLPVLLNKKFSYIHIFSYIQE